MARADFVDSFIDRKLTRVEHGVRYGGLSDDGLTTVEISVANIEKLEAGKISVAKPAGAIMGGIVPLPVAAAVRSWA